MAAAHQIPKIPAQRNSCLFARFIHVIFQLLNWRIVICVTPWRMDPVSWIIILQLNWLSIIQRRKRQALDKSRGQRFAQKTWQLYFGQQLTFSLGPIGQKQRQKPFHNLWPEWRDFYLHTFVTFILSLLLYFLYYRLQFASFGWFEACNYLTKPFMLSQARFPGKEAWCIK